MTDKIGELEAAILGQAEQLAEEYRAQAQRSCRNILQEARDCLHVREEREILLAKAMAERSYRRQVLSQELALQAKLDRLRWGLVRAVQERLQSELQTLAKDEARYLPLLRDFIARSAAQFSQQALVVEANASDRALLAAAWDDICNIAADKQLTLGEAQLDCSGGVLLRTPDNCERLDQTFEGRMHRLSAELHRVIQETLLPPSPEQQHPAILS